MPPKDDEPCTCEPEETEETEELEELEVHNYQIKYVRDDGVGITEIIEATYIYTDEDHVDIWYGDVLMLMIQRNAIQQIRNVSKLDLEIL